MYECSQGPHRHIAGNIIGSRVSRVRLAKTLTFTDDDILMIVLRSPLERVSKLFKLWRIVSYKRSRSGTMLKLLERLCDRTRQSGCKKWTNPLRDIGKLQRKSSNLRGQYINEHINIPTHAQELNARKMCCPTPHIVSA
jgi:hypothetical protein